MDKHKQRNEAPQMTDVFVPEAKSIPIIRQARKKNPSSFKHIGTHKPMHEYMNTRYHPPCGTLR